MENIQNDKNVFSTHLHSDCLIKEYIYFLGLKRREYLTPSLLKEEVHLHPRKNNYLEPWQGA